MNIPIRCSTCKHFIMFTNGHYSQCALANEHYVVNGRNKGCSKYHLNWDIYNRLRNND